MEAAWREVEQHGGAGAGAGVGDPDLQAVWDDQAEAGDAGMETLEGVWSRTAASLEAGEGVCCPCGWHASGVAYDFCANRSDQRVP